MRTMHCRTTVLAAFLVTFVGLRTASAEQGSGQSPAPYRGQSRPERIPRDVLVRTVGVMDKAGRAVDATATALDRSRSGHAERITGRSSRLPFRRRTHADAAGAHAAIVELFAAASSQRSELQGDLY